jgi:hypothetical protein
MLLITLGAAPGPADNLLPPAHRRFLMHAIRSALVSRHPELQSSVGLDAGALGAVEINLEAIAAMAQRAVITGAPRDPNELFEQLDQHVCPHCAYNAPNGQCELHGADRDNPRTCMLRRYGPTILDAVKDALLKLAAGPQA